MFPLILNKGEHQVLKVFLGSFPRAAQVATAEESFEQQPSATVDEAPLRGIRRDP